MYWISGLLAISEVALFWHDLRHPDRPFFDEFPLPDLCQEYAPVAVAALLILSLVLYDTMALSNRFAGPIYRLRR